MEALADDITERQVKPGDAIRIGASNASDPMVAINEIQQQIWQPDTAFVLLFTSPEYDHRRLAMAIDCAFSGIPVLGCTTAGEITPLGYAEGAVSAISFSSRHFAMACKLIKNVNAKGIGEYSEVARSLDAEFEEIEDWRKLALLVADGMSLQEDAIVAAMDAALAPVPLFGGSAGDGLCFKETFVFHDGAFHSDSALLILLQTDYRFTGVTFDHFLPSTKQMVVTEARPEKRIVCEINGEPAADEYARIIGYPKSDLGPFLFASFPTLVRAGGRYHVRAIQSVLEGGCLKFLSAIDVGLVLTIGEGQDICGEMEKVFHELANEYGKPSLVLGFDCILRKIEIVTSGKKERISGIFAENNVIGFSTYGEHHNGMHVNQTFVGVAFYEPEPGAQQ